MIAIQIVRQRSQLSLQLGTLSFQLANDSMNTFYSCLGGYKSLLVLKIQKNFAGLVFCFAIAIPAALLGTFAPVVGGPVFAMLIGRLEIFTVLIILTPAFWKR